MKTSNAEARMVDLFKGYALQTGSTLVHKLPFLMRLAKQVTHLDGPSDVLLRWRMVSDRSVWQSFVNEHATFEGPDDATFADRSSWGMGVVAVERASMEAALNRPSKTPRQQAIAYRLGSVVMVGVREKGKRDFLSGVTMDFGDARSMHNPYSDHLGVVVDNGPGVNMVAIGTAQNGGRDIQLLTTKIVTDVAHIPHGLQHV